MVMMNRRFWTINSLVGAFLDLYIAFFLLFGSTIALISIRFLGLFGLSLPSAYNPENPNSEFKSLLVDYPTDKISAVQYSVTRKFPFDSVFYRVNESNGLNLESNNSTVIGNGIVNDEFRELEGEESCSSKSNARKLAVNETDDSHSRIEKQKDKGIDVKGKGGFSYRLRGSFRRRRKGSLDSGRHSSVSSSTNWVTCVDQQSNNENETGDGFQESCNYEGDASIGVEFDSPSDILKRIPVDEADKDKLIVILKRELEESHAIRAALYVELDKERNAAATAADEAMSMILRLQEEKASIEMESHQYQRMIEEKSAYDEEEMNILKEIVLRREREKHFLEKEVEAYRMMVHVENDQFSNQDSTEDPDLMLHRLSMNVSNTKDSNLFEDVYFLKQEEPEKTIAIVGEEKVLDTGKVLDTEKVLDAESRIYDVHVIDHDPKSSEKSKGNKKQSRNGSETSSMGLPPVIPRSSLRRYSTSALDNERTKLDTEVECLREKLRVVQEGREKLNVVVDNREKESLQLQLLEDIASQLQEIRMLTEPRTVRQASLPLPSSKISTKKRRCRSASLGHANSS
ncbi:uncharacterized protein [Rutidosis leptorrhynchoides]|uniref:uncharacterized protein n=1 Tax=Rutidosis leptorrhynchoides TaxID=125765 RepID=UPI003A99CC45